MESAASMKEDTKELLYQALNETLVTLLNGERHFIPNLSNASALLFQTLPDINWAGFYLMAGDELLLGPFQGKPACVHIPVTSGVCGAAARSNETQLVADVHQFPGHIACDSASNSEIVIPLRNQDDEVIGVLDIDSPLISRFSRQDQEGLETFAAILEKCCDWDIFL